MTNRFQRSIFFLIGCVVTVAAIALMGAAASFIARLLNKHRWIAYVGLAIILYVALDMIYRGAPEVWPIARTAANVILPH